MFKMAMDVCKDLRRIGDEIMLEDDFIAAKKEIENLRAELSRRTLKWQSGKPPITGWYWFNDPVDSYISVTWLSSSKEYKRWAGPIEPPEEV